jgi:hypothetical protein
MQLIGSLTAMAVPPPTPVRMSKLAPYFPCTVLHIGQPEAILAQQLSGRNTATVISDLKL